MSEETADLLKVVNQRKAYVTALGDGLCTKSDLTESFEASQSTVDRTVRELVEEGIAREVDDGFTLTPYGQLLHRQYQRFVSHVSDLTRARTVLNNLPDAATIDPQILDGACVHEPDPYVPLEPLKRVQKRLERAESVVGYMPVFLPHYIDSICDQDECRTEFTIFVPTPVHDTLLSETATEYEFLLELEQWEFCRSDIELPYSVVLIDESVVIIIIYDKESSFRGVLEVKTDAAVRWATDIIERCRENHQK